MSFITDIEWKGASTFEEIATWFIDPMREFLEMFDEQYGMNEHGPEDKRAVFFYYEMKNKLNDLEKLLYRLGDDYNKNPLPNDDFLKELKEHFKKLKEAGLDPKELLRGWLKEHNPDYFKN